MKRTPLKRSPFKRKDTWKKLRHASKVRVKDLKIYSGLRLQYLAEHLICSVCRKRNSTQIHHMRGRGIFLNDTRYFLACCYFCHSRITYNPQWAFDRGYSIDRIGI